MLPHNRERLSVLKKVNLTAGFLSLAILGACSSEGSNQQVIATGYTISSEANPTIDHEITVDGDQECPDAFRGTITVDPGKSWVHIIDGVVVYRSDSLGNADGIDSWQSARDHFCEYSHD